MIKLGRSYFHRAVSVSYAGLTLKSHIFALKSQILDPTFKYCRKEEHNNHSKLCPIYGSRVINPYALGPRILGHQTLSPESQGPEGRGPKIHRTSGPRPLGPQDLGYLAGIFLYLAGSSQYFAEIA